MTTGKSGAITRRQVLSTLAAPVFAQRKRKPNIVFILADDLSYRDLSAWGQQRYQTPNLDALAANGLRFTNAYAGAAECAPSRGTLLTGRHTGHAAIRLNASARGQDHLGPDDITVAQILKSAGYATAITGKWGVGLPGSPGTPDKKGFDFSYGFYDQRRAHTYFPEYMDENGGKVPHPENKGFRLDLLYKNNVPHPTAGTLNEYDESGKLIPRGIPSTTKPSFSETMIEKKAVEWLRRNAGNPFFLYFATQLPHGPTVIDELGELRTHSEYPSIRHKEWAAMVMRLDRFTGQLVELLKELGVYDNTLIVFASDNGYANPGYFGRGNAATNWPDDPFLRNKGPFHGGKFEIYEGGTRVPFFMHWPGRIAAGICNTPVWLIDLLPTFAAVAGAKVQHKVDGISLVPLFQAATQGSFPKMRPLYWECRASQAVRLGPWRGYRKSTRDALQLFLIEEDPLCERNLAALYPAVVREIEQIMTREHVDHPWYWNPGETAEDFKRKQARAKELGQLQVDELGNTNP